MPLTPLTDKNVSFIHKSNYQHIPMRDGRDFIKYHDTDAKIFLNK